MQQLVFDRAKQKVSLGESIMNTKGFKIVQENAAC